MKVWDKKLYLGILSCKLALFADCLGICTVFVFVMCSIFHDVFPAL